MESKGKFVNTATSTIINKLLSLFFGAFNEFSALTIQVFIQILIFWTDYQPIQSDNELQSIGDSSIINMTIINVLVAIIEVQLLLFAFIERTFINLLFKSSLLLTARRTQGIFLDFFKPAFSILVISLSLKPNLSVIERVIFVAIIAIFSNMKLYLSGTSNVYFDDYMQNIDILSQVLSASFFTSSLILCITENSNAEVKSPSTLMVVLAWSFVAVACLGVVIILRKNQQSAIVDKMSHLNSGGSLENIQKRSSKLAEQGAYLLVKFMDSSDSSDHKMFQSFLIKNEESIIIQEQMSYYQIITDVLKEALQTDTLDDEEEKQLNNQSLKSHAPLNSKICMLDGSDLQALGTSNFPLTSVYSYDYFDSKQMGGGAAGIKELYNYHGKESNADRLTTRTQHIVNEQLRQMAAGYGIARYEAEGFPHLLADLFNSSTSQNLDQIGPSSYIKNIAFAGILKKLRMGPGSFENSNQEEAIKLIKIRFLYDMVAKRCHNEYPQSIVLMFFKALIALERLQNKYLTLTTITQIAQHSQKVLSYVQQIQTKISEIYFVETCLNQEHNRISRGNTMTISKEESNSKWTENEKVIDLNEMLDQSLEIDKILNKLRNCSAMISQFWQLYSSEHLNRKNFKTFLKLTVRISQSLFDIRTKATNQIDDMNSFLQKSDQMCISLSLFYSVVLRDQAISTKIASRVESQVGFNASFKDNSIDDIGVIVVDGNFDLYGKIIFGNRKILKQLCYSRLEDVAGKTVHSIMPRVVADIHNQFWRGFANLGEPKVLDQVRYLYAKDARGFIQPYKVFIKFQYNPHFGYSFVGMFKKPKDIIINSVETPIKLIDTYHLVCNQKGIILEVSKSCSQLFGLTPDLIDQIQSKLEEGLKLSIFNKNELNLQEMDFEQNTSLYFKSILLDFNPLIREIKQIETFDMVYDEDAKPLYVCQNLRVQLKIIKEIYGLGSIKEPLNVYYVVFSEAPALESVSIMSTYRRPSSVNAGPAQLANIQKQNIDRDLLKGNMNSNVDTRDNIGYSKIRQTYNNGSFMNQSKTAGQTPSGSQIMSKKELENFNDDDDQFRTGSVSSSMASTASMKESSITAIDEDFEDQKTPRLMIGLRIAISILLITLIGLSTIQYLLNMNFSKEQIKDEQLLLIGLKAQEHIVELSLLSRMYMNIQLGLEPSSSLYIENRVDSLKVIAFDLIDKVHNNIEDIKLFLGKEQLQAFSILVPKTGTYSLLSNQTIEYRRLPMLYALNLWLVNLNEIFSYDRFNSTMGTFLFSQDKKLTTFDQLAFFISVNGQQSMSSLFNPIVAEQDHHIQYQASTGIIINQMFSLTSAIIIFASALSIVYLTIAALQMKNKMLEFFGKLTKEQMEQMDCSAHAYELFVITGDQQIIMDYQQSYIQLVNQEIPNQVMHQMLQRNLTQNELNETPKLPKKPISNQYQEQQSGASTMADVFTKFNSRQNVLRESLESFDDVKAMSANAKNIRQQFHSAAVSVRDFPLNGNGVLFTSGQSHFSKMKENSKSAQLKKKLKNADNSDSDDSDQESWESRSKKVKPTINISNFEIEEKKEPVKTLANFKHTQSQVSSNNLKVKTSKRASVLEPKKKVEIKEVEKVAIEDDQESDDNDSKRSRKRREREKAKKDEELNSQMQQNELLSSSKTREVLRLMKARLRQITWRLLLPFAFCSTGILVIYFIVQYLMFEKQQIQVISNSRSIADLMKSLQCSEMLISEIRQTQVSNSTLYNLTLRSKLTVESYSIQQSEILASNNSFQRCLKLNQNVQQWLQTYRSGEFYLDGKQEKKSLCHIFDGDTQFSEEKCKKAYQGALQQPPLQSTSLFLQDAMHSSIQFISFKNRDSSFISDILKSDHLIELLDSHTFYEQNALRRYYELIVATVLNTQDSNSTAMTLFGVFVSIMAVTAIVLELTIFAKLRKWFWNTFLLLQLLPRDDLDREFIKSINEFLIKA